MKPFDLQDALSGAPVVTRSGLRVTDVRHLPSGEYTRIAAVLGGRIYDWHEDGRWVDVIVPGDEQDPLDLMMAEP